MGAEREKEGEGRERGWDSSGSRGEMMGFRRIIFTMRAAEKADAEIDADKRERGTSGVASSKFARQANPN